MCFRYGKIEKSFRFLVGIKSKTENPPAGTEAGVKVLTALSARFALKAPGKSMFLSWVILISFNRILHIL